MERYQITRATGAPDWSQVPFLQVENILWLPKTETRMAAQLCYDASGIHVHLCAHEKHIRAEHRMPLAMVCEDSCMEFFFSPVEDDARYFNIEMNPLGTAYIGFGTDRHNLVRLVLKEEDTLLRKRAARLEGGWELFYTVPISLLRLFYPNYSLRSGMKIRANIYKCGDLTENPHYIAWNNIELPNPEFHAPEFFGEMTFE